MSLICSLYVVLKSLHVCPTYTCSHVKHLSSYTPKLCEYCKYTIYFNMRHDAGKQTPGFATPIISTPKYLPNIANMSLKKIRDNGVKRTPGVAGLSSLLGYRISSEVKRISGTHCDITPVSVRWAVWSSWMLTSLTLTKCFSNFFNRTLLHRRSMQSRTTFVKFPTHEIAVKWIRETSYRW
jgi:hypothetical protein